MNGEKNIPRNSIQWLVHNIYVYIILLNYPQQMFLPTVLYLENNDRKVMGLTGFIPSFRILKMWILQ